MLEVLSVSDCLLILTEIGYNLLRYCCLSTAFVCVSLSLWRSPVRSLFKCFGPIAEGGGTFSNRGTERYVSLVGDSRQFCDYSSFVGAGVLVTIALLGAPGVSDCCGFAAFSGYFFSAFSSCDAVNVERI